MSWPKRTNILVDTPIGNALCAAVLAGGCTLGPALLTGYPVGLSSIAALAAAGAGAWCSRRKLRRAPLATAPAGLLGAGGHVIAPTASPDDVRDALEHWVRSRIACDAVELRLSGLSSDLGGARCHALASGAHRIVRAEHHTEHQISALITFDGAVFGELFVKRRQSARSFAGQDEIELRNIADASGFMVAHAVAYGELEQRRRQQAAAFREEREALVETLSAEIAHEVRYPINFFRSIFQRASEDRVLEREDLEIGSEEVDRLERLVSGLRRMAIQLDRRLADVTDLACRAEALLRDRMNRQRLTLNLGSAAALRCDVDKITQVLVNLLANALDATAERGDVGLDWRLTGHGGELIVWDTGAGFSGDPARLFAPWYTTKPRGTGLGLAIVYRMVRAHGWMIEAARRDGRTVFVIAIPLGDVSEAGARDYASGEGIAASPVAAMPARREGAA